MSHTTQPPPRPGRGDSAGRSSATRAVSFLPRWLWRTLRRPVVVLLTLPAGTAITLGVLPLALVLIAPWAPELPFELEPDDVRTVLSTLSTAAMSALALSYSLMLVVFTLAAGNIGPRLLKRFTSDPVGQLTAGLLGGTFLYGLVGQLVAAHAPETLALTAVLLALGSVLQLVVFVRKVAASVSIDDEVARIRASLLADVEGRPERPESRESRDARSLELDAVAHVVRAATSGYLGAIDTDGLVQLASSRELRLRLTHRQGLYVLRGEPLLESDGPLDEDDEIAIRAALTLSPSREADSLDFALSLLLEIALRALSPGVNDTYTAIACADSLGDVLARLDGKQLGGSGLTDESDTIRLIQPGLDLEDLADQVFHPLRNASVGNLLMLDALARVLGRLATVGSAQLIAIASAHRELMLEQLTSEACSLSDRDRLRTTLLRETAPLRDVSAPSAHSS